MLKAWRYNHLHKGWWLPEATPPVTDNASVYAAIRQITKPLFVTEIDDKFGISHVGCAHIGQDVAIRDEGYPLCAYAPPISPQSFGDSNFKKDHRLQYPYIAGAMANGITSARMVVEMGNAGMIGFFGAGGLTISDIESAIHQVQHELGAKPYGFNLIHSPFDPELEKATVDLYLSLGVQCVSAAAFLDLTLPLIYYRVKGIHLNEKDEIVCPNRVIAKVSRIEVARKFLSPPPDKFLGPLVEKGMITQKEAELARHIPVAHDLTAEADSGGHTDNRPAISLLPTMMALRDELNEKYQYKRPICVGLAGGIATPMSTAAAFAMGAGYVLVGSINQACVESGTSDIVREMIAEAKQADVTMAPAADMFEMGIKLQVLKRGTMFPLRAAKLYDFYCQNTSIDDLSSSERKLLERDYFQQSIESEWEQTKRFFKIRDSKQVDRAEKDPKH
ncbi:MAG: PfaD family polyunsaturated fatty acid/polyketide biosynthesis protein, partial [bacterium]|nr:PfaD family polyunsaturated fatty acid/polyketide biosynthesis protein [bacterium]